MEVNIEQKEVLIISKIVVDGKEYPIHVWNLDWASQYLATKDEKCLEQLKDFSLEI